MTDSLSTEASTEFMQSSEVTAASSYGNLESTPNDDEDADASSRKSSTNRFLLGRKSSKILRQEDMRVKAVISLALSVKRKSDALEERNAISVFSRTDAAGILET